MASEKEQQRMVAKSVWILPFAQQGHINPMIQLAKALASRGALITFLVPQTTLSARSSLEMPGISFLGVDDELPPERSRGSNFRDSIDSMINMEGHFARLVAECREQIAILIYDAFMTWAPKIASALSVNSSCFFTSNATCGALFQQIPTLIERGILPFRPDDDSPLPTTKVRDLDGVPDILPEEFPLCATFSASHFRYKFITQIGATLGGATSIIVNTVEELEPEGIAALNAHAPVFAVGPLLLVSGRPTRLAVNYWPEDDHCLPWLDSQPPSSVLFVSFGSVASLSLNQFEELATGLEASRQRFLWVVRPDSIDVPLQQALPAGFIERTKDRCTIISWGPQLLILSHPSIGGFFTHGGWNSISENISTGSVPMICWPHVAEQRLNRFLMSHMWKIGLRLKHREDGSVSSEEIAGAITNLFHGREATELRNASKQLGELVKKAAVEGGSSFKNLCDFYSLIL
ncbi:hypothetical protein KP509_16G029000 [Ceratopteris richardii]|uniref:Glycosyltransferase n=1 Tax=Ceratopteris richardii TaxID=49495 RepID=A0A8T2SXJ4_CERRI|nr:hypothetical protein KP509_16G029000 [Ceratopteris richardii]